MWFFRIFPKKISTNDSKKDTFNSMGISVWEYDSARIRRYDVVLAISVVLWRGLIFSFRF